MSQENNTFCFKLPQWAVDEGWELDRIGIPKDGEIVLHNDRCLIAHMLNAYCVIVRKKHKWPKELKPGWITVDEDGEVTWWPPYTQLLVSSCSWVTHEHSLTLGIRIGRAMNIELPHYEHWHQAWWNIKQSAETHEHV